MALSWQVLNQVVKSRRILLKNGILWYLFRIMPMKIAPLHASL